MTQDANNLSAPDRTRACPTCRMLISILATKCRFCGAELGRPREETRSLSANDLGGETIQHYVPSTNVMEALEAFRADEAAPIVTAKGKATSVRRDASKGAAALPELDEKSRGLSTSSLPRRPRRMGESKAKSRRGGISSYVKYVVYVVVLAVVAGGLYAARGTIMDTIHSFGKKEEVKKEIVNPAINLLRNNGPLDQALQGAIDTYNATHSDADKKVLDEVRDRIAARTKELLDAPTGQWNSKTLREANQLVDTALSIDPCDLFRTLKDEVSADVNAYGIILSEVQSGDEPVAVFKLSGQELRAKSGEVVADRFKVVSIARDSAKLVDQKRANRAITCDTFGGLQ